MEPNNFKYRGKLMQNYKWKGIIHDVAFAPYPLTIAFEAQDVLAVTGEGGTYIYGRFKDPDALFQSMDGAWKLLYHVDDLRGHMLCWNPIATVMASNLSGHLMVAIKPTNQEAGKVFTLQRERGPAPPVEPKCIYNAAYGQDISRLKALKIMGKSIISMCYGNNHALVFPSQARAVHSMRWVELGPLNWKWRRADILFDKSNNLNDLVGCSPSINMGTIFAVSNSYCIKIFGWVEDVTIQWEELCQVRTGTKIIHMALNGDGSTLATLNEHKQLLLFGVSPWTEDHTRRLYVSYELPQSNPISHMCWSSRFNFLVISGPVLSDLQVLNADNKRLHKKVLKGTLGIDPFNTLFMPISCPYRGRMLATVGYRQFIHFWEDGPSHRLSVVQRDVFQEQYYNHVVTNRDDSCTMLVSASDACVAASDACLGASRACLEASKNFKLLENDYMKVGEGLKNRIRSVYEGSDVKLEMLEQVYASGKFSKEKIQEVEDDDDLEEEDLAQDSSTDEVEVENLGDDSIRKRKRNEDTVTRED